jgi:transglutaminase-like putative cysteine protease
MDHRIKGRFIALSLVLLWGVITLLKFTVYNYSIRDILPQKAYTVKVAVSGQNSGRSVSIKHFLPPTGMGQRVLNESVRGNYNTYNIGLEGSNRLLEYAYSGAVDTLRATASFTVIGRHIRYDIPRDISTDKEYSPSLQRWLKPTQLIQSDDPAIIELSDSLGISGSENAYTIFKKAYDYAYNEIGSVVFSGETDALLTSQLGEASCNGKSRLMVALLRSTGIPSRLVGGFIMKDNVRKRTTHQWVEAYLNGSWVSFCPLNGYFAEKPAHYLKFYTGDHAFFRHTKNISFDYYFSSVKSMIPPRGDTQEHAFFDLINIWTTFQEAGLSLGMISSILIIPLGAIITIIFRNVIGLKIFGTFLPALIAYSFLDIGFWWGTGVFVVIILTGAIINILLDSLKILHTPRLTIIMISTALILASVGYWGIINGWSHLAKTFFFPLVIMSVTIEKFFTLVRDRGPKEAFLILFSTMIVVGACYSVMRSVFLQMLIIILPETFFLVIAAAIYLGHWIDLRISELFRFRSLLFKSAEPARSTT